jgi:hypothetical protein
MKEALKQIADLLHPVAALADETPFENSEVIQRCVDASEIALDALAQPEQEPIGYAVPTFDFDNSVIKTVHYAGTVPLYTTPPQRTWVGLTDEEAHGLYNNRRTPSNLIDMVEAKLKEKNT